MANTYQLITHTVLASPASSISFNSIPQTYNDLILRINSRATAAADVHRMFFYFNTIDSGTSYNYANLAVSGAISWEKSTSTNALKSQLMPASTASANSFDINEIYIPNYTNATLWKNANNFQGTTASTTNHFLFYGTGNKQNTAAVTSLHIGCSSTFDTNTTVSLYGIKNT